MACAMLLGQLGTLGQPAAKAKQHVTYVAEAQTVSAAKKSVLELRFHIDEGFHVNSHTPKSELQIATALQVGISEEVKTWTPEYPVGKEFSFAFDPSEKLDVYSDDFVVKVPVIASAGPHELTGKLTYQACDKAACFPVRTLPVDVVFTAK